LCVQYEQFIFYIVKNYQIVDDLTKVSNGKLISSPVIIAYANQKALIVMTNTNKDGAQGLRMELVARDISKFGRNDDIGINYDIESKNGKEKMHARPQVIVAPNQESRISLASDSGHSYEM
jgi:hypothetical protein